MNDCGKHISKSNSIVFYKKIPFIVSIILGIYLCGLTPKTPNYSWMGVLNKDIIFNNFFENFFNLRIPIFRPYLFVELINYKLFDNLWIANNLLYGVICGCLFYLVYRSIQLSTNYSIPILIISFMFPAYIWAADGGIIYDIVFSFGIAFLIYCFFRLNSSKIKITELVCLAIVIWLCDMSRPFFLNMIPLIFLFLYLKYKFRKTLFIFILFFVLAAPFHYLQYRHTGGLSLSNYGGCNLYEVFPFGIECKPSMNRSAINTDEFTNCCKDCGSEISKQIFNNPSIIFKYAINKTRLLSSIQPSLDWHGSSTMKKYYSESIQKLFNLSLFFLYLYWTWGLLKLLFKRDKLLECAFVIIIIMQLFVFNLLAHNLTEQIRVYLPTLSAIIISSFLFRSKNTLDKITDS